MDASGPPTRSRVASCWLQQCPNIVSDLKWARILPVIEALVEEYGVGSAVDTSWLLVVGPDGKLQLQVIWQGEVGEVSPSPSFCLGLNMVLIIV